MKDYYNILLEEQKIISDLYNIMNSRLNQFYEEHKKNPDPNLISDKFFCQILNEAILKESIFKNYSFVIRPTGISLRNNDVKIRDSLIIDKIGFSFLKNTNQYKINSIFLKKILNKKDNEFISIAFEFNDNNILEKFNFNLDNKNKSYLAGIIFSNNKKLIKINASEYNDDKLNKNDLWKASNIINNINSLSKIKEKEVLNELSNHLFNLFVENIPIPKEKIDFLSIMYDLDLSTVNQLNNYFIDVMKINLDSIYNETQNNQKQIRLKK